MTSLNTQVLIFLFLFSYHKGTIKKRKKKYQSDIVYLKKRFTFEEQTQRDMKTLIKNITTEFEYVNDSEYYFSSTIEGKEYEITGTIHNGYVMFLEMFCNNESFQNVEVSKALNKYSRCLPC